MTAGVRTTFRTFAYGSNILSARLKKRRPSARRLGVAQLPGHEFRWHKCSTDGSGTCDVIPVNVDPAVFEVVYEIDAIEKAGLDQVEGLGYGYEQKAATVILSGNDVAVSIYVATKADQRVRPYTWDKALVVAGAKEHGLPASYNASLESVEALEDPGRTRHDSKMRIFSAAGHGEGAQA